MTISDKRFDDLKKLYEKRFQFESSLIFQQKRPKYSHKILSEEIKNRYSNNELVLVLGAGISASCKIPTWDRLMDNLLSDTFEENRSSSSVYPTIFKHIYRPNYLMTARYISNLYEKDKFVDRVKELLYSKEIVNSELISEIANLCIHERKIDSVITYNYDDLLEENIRIKKDEQIFESIHKDACTLDKNKLPIFHVHGFLPRNDKMETATSIVLTEDSYHEQYQNIYSWQNIIQIDKFSNKSCLFIGISLTDPNMRRLLDIAKRQVRKDVTHYIIKLRHKYPDIKKQLEKFKKDKDNDTQARLLATLDATATLTLIDKIHDFEEEDAQSLNLKTLWVNDFDEVPKILKNLNKKTDETPNH
jgi:NAD-dependent SIR2 family protein deacetylase